MRAFPVRMPSGSRYWTVLDEGMNVVPVADRYLRELRFGRDRAESTTEKYASGIALFLRWCKATGRDWREAAADFGLFMTWLKYVPAGGGTVTRGPGAAPARGERQVNRILVADNNQVQGMLADSRTGTKVALNNIDATTADVPQGQKIPSEPPKFREPGSGATLPQLAPEKKSEEMKEESK